MTAPTGTMTPGTPAAGSPPQIAQPRRRFLGGGSQRVVSTVRSRPGLMQFLLLWALVIFSIMLAGGGFFGNLLWTALLTATVVLVTARKYMLAALTGFLFLIMRFFRDPVMNFFGNFWPDSWNLPNLSALFENNLFGLAVLVFAVFAGVALIIVALKRP